MNTNLSKAQQWLDDVRSGKQIAGKLIKQAVARHFDDLETGTSRGLYFDEDAGHRICEFLETFCIPSGSEKPFNLMPWQAGMLYVIYGWKRKDGTRRFRTVLCEVSKKSGKSEMCAGLCIHALIAAGEPSARVFVAATTRKQSSIVFKSACMMVKRSPDLKDLIKQSGIEPPLALYVTETGSRCSALSRDADTNDGILTTWACCDEIHRWKTGSNLYSVLRYGGRTCQNGAMLFQITTAGSSAGGTSLAWNEREYVCKILDGLVVDDDYAGFVFSMDEDDDWKDDKNWPKCCPSMGDVSAGYLFPLETVKKELAEAQGKPASLGEFRRFCLNQWSSEAENPAIELARWLACSRVPVSKHPDPIKLRAESMRELKGRTCFGGIDLAPKIDTSSLVLMFPPRSTAEKWRILEWYWIPASNIAARVKRDRVPYDAWRDQGFLTTTEGNMTDPRAIADQMMQIIKDYDLKEIYYDQSWSSELVRMLGEAGFPLNRMVEFPQTHNRMNAPCNEWSRKILRQELSHDNNPVSNWQVSNLRWNVQKNTNFIRVDRDRKREKVDFCSSSIMALAAAISPDNRPRPSFFVVTSA
jgi:phage terminase large subunit-like protein